METLNKLIWSENFWLGGNYSWTEFENTPELLEAGYYIPQIQDLNWSLLFGVFLLGFRYLYEKYLVVPIARKFGIKKERSIVVQPNLVLEDAYKKTHTLDDQAKLELSKKVDMSVRQVETWFRQRTAKDAISTMQKFRECSWHFLFHFGGFLYGITVLWSKPWFWETKQCWIGWPKQYVTNDVYWYYMMELGFYWSLFFTMRADHKRKDSLEMTIHHLATIFLMYFSWVMNFVRVGTLVMLVHNAPDFWMMAAKMTNYAKWNTATEIFFTVFVIVWIISRLILHPFVIIYCTLIEPYGILLNRTNASHILFNSFLILLQILHIIWSYMIAKVVMKKLTKGKISDVRSDSESSDEEENTKHKLQNGNTVTLKSEEEEESRKVPNECHLVNGNTSTMNGHLSRSSTYGNGGL